MRIDKEGFQLSRDKLGRDSEGCRTDIGMGCCNTNI